ncbi:uncharacterized protein LOC109822332 [Asparagus officinalis]|uniref:uncharacterized protein LOC109822332 n=1 Tax=Asparagus officinalis TaxID=4686 RepID=UPI00098E70E0|nr:uncharacterized protein LOC109822332 [Asparagus officinalis]
MGRYLKQYDKDYMKMAMIKQEETFKQQVHELHRLYRVQKLLMNDMKAEIKRQRSTPNIRNKLNGWSRKSESDPVKQCKSNDNQRSSYQVLNLELPAEEYIGKDDGDAMQEAEEESGLELTLATGCTGRRKKKESSFTSDSGASFSSSSTESGGARLNGNDWGLFQVKDVNLMSEERVNRPPWLFQCLSLNMT